MDYAEVWSGEYRGVRYRIIKEASHDDGTWWWGEVILVPAQIDPEFHGLLFPKGKLEVTPTGNEYPNWAKPKFSDLPRSLDTFKVESANGLPKFKAAYLGWDYQHLWDEHYPYSVTDIEADCKKFIDRLHQLFKILTRCDYCGKWGDPDKEGWIDPGFGKWKPIHPECDIKRLEYARQHPTGDDCD